MRWGIPLWLRAAFDEAWDLFRPQPDALDLVVIDRCLGDRSGLELLSAMRAEHPQFAMCVGEWLRGRSPATGRPADDQYPKTIPAAPP